MRVLNLYAGIGGNRHLWPSTWKITAVEIDEKVAQEYARRYPEDVVIVGDAHEYLEAHYQEFELIWSSPPCPTHSKVARWTRHKKRFPDMTLYEEIIFLKHFFKGHYVVENVIPFYEPLIAPNYQISRHTFWTNLDVSGDFHIETFKNSKGVNSHKTATTAGRSEIMAWLEMPDLEKNIYVKGSNDPCKVARNCIHPKLALHVVKGLIE